LFVEPFYLGQRLAFRTVPITAGVVGGALKATAVTLLEVATESRSATAHHGLHDLEMGDRQRMVAAIGLTIGAKDIGQFNAALYRCRLLRAGTHGLERR
jgi:hypothetical protein